MKPNNSFKDVYRNLREVAFDMSILLVEDDEMLLKQLDMFVSKFFGSTTLASDGQEALQLYEQKQYDLILTDLSMPNMDGIELVKKVKSINAFQHIVLVSAYSEDNKLLDLINMGVNGYIRKPLEMELVLKQLLKSCQAIYDHNMLEYFNNTLEETNEELKNTNEELQQTIRKLINTEAEITKPNLSSRELNADEKTMLYTRREKMSATTFFEVYPFELDRTNENLEELEDMFNIMLADAEQNINHDTLLTLTEILRDFGKEIELIPQFSQLAYGIQQLERTFESIDDHSKLPTVMPMVTSLFDNLENWRKGIFYYRDVDDIHYMDNSIISDALSLQGFLTNTHSSSDSDMELF